MVISLHFAYQQIFCFTESVWRNILFMIASFRCLDTQALFQSVCVAKFANIERTARRKLLMLHAAPCLHSLRIPPGNRLEALRGDRKGQHSIRINDQWRICFVWLADAAHDVEIIDYH
jgi:proteic killer suppression protein